MIKSEFLSESKRIFALNPHICALNDEQLEKLYELTEIMLEVNSHMNLTAITDMQGVILKHYVDSLAVSAYIPDNSKVIDVGCGAGFPSLPLAIVRPDLLITPLDSTAKRIKYVQDTANELGLSNVSAVAARAEELANKTEHREVYDVAVARAVADLPVLSELCMAFVKVGGSFVPMKAAKGDQEVENAANAIKICGGKIEQNVRCDITANSVDYEQRRIVVVKKIAKTPSAYPRNFGRIQKKPL